MIYLLAVVLAYLIGSFPSGVVVVRIVRGTDVRRFGSRRSGATNVLRVAGTFSALLVFLLDLGKGAAAVLVGQWLAGSAWVGERFQGLFGRPPAWPLPPETLSALWAGLASGLAAVAGHNWPIYIRFRGGRGVATTLGTVFPLAPIVAGATFLVGAILIVLTRYVSLGSVTGAGLLPVGLLVQFLVGYLALPVLLYGVLAGGLVIFQHHDNIARLWAGTERKLGQPAEPPPGQP